MPRENTSLADSVALAMNRIVESDEHKQLFTNRYILDKTAGGCADDDGENEGKGKGQGQKHMFGKKKEKGEEKDDKKKKLPPWLQKGKKDKEGEDDDECFGKGGKGKGKGMFGKGMFGKKPGFAFETAVRGLNKIADLLDDMGLEKSAYATVRSLEILIRH
jgi:hypothetical protein